MAAATFFASPLVATVVAAMTCALRDLVWIFLLHLLQGRFQVYGAARLTSVEEP